MGEITMNIACFHKHVKFQVLDQLKNYILLTTYYNYCFSFLWTHDQLLDNHQTKRIRLALLKVHKFN